MFASIGLELKDRRQQGACSPRKRLDTTRRGVGGRLLLGAENPVVSPVAPASQTRLLGIEGLRALAAAAVVVTHAGEFSSRRGEFAAGPIAEVTAPFAAGVLLFFVLSGFLLYRPFAVAVVRGQPLPSIRRYYRNRALRILPAYWVILAVTVFVLQSAVVGFDPPRYTTGRFHDLGVFLKNLFLVHNYSPGTIGTGITPTWSLAIEVVFYAALPALALAAVRSRGRLRRHKWRPWAVLAPVVLMAVIGFAGKLTATLAVPGPQTSFTPSWHSVVQFSFFAYADVFAWGMLVAVLKVLHDEGLIGLPARTSRVYAEAALLVVFAAWLLVLPPQTRGWAAMIVPVPFALLLAFVVVPNRANSVRPAFVRLLESRAFVATGVVSYSIFLWNVPVLFWMREHGLLWYGPAGFVATLLLVAVVCAFLSAISYRFVEAPALRLKASAFAPASAPLLRVGEYIRLSPNRPR
jgi:peptidoglycan/LPS O-acetylase OafA/YrhL